LFADHQFPDGLLSLLQPFLQTDLSRFARIDRLNDQTAFLPAERPIPFGDLHFDQRLISLCNAFRLVGFCLAHHLDQRRACRQIGFHVLSQGGWWNMQGRKRAQVEISLRLDMSACLFGSHFAIPHVQQACSLQTLMHPIDQGHIDGSSACSPESTSLASGTPKRVQSKPGQF